MRHSSRVVSAVTDFLRAIARLCRFTPKVEQMNSGVDALAYGMNIASQREILCTAIISTNNNAQVFEPSQLSHKVRT